MDATPYPLFTPVCFEAETMISVPGGRRPARDLRAGDMIEDIHGVPHQIVWTSSRVIDLSVFGPRARSTIAPVVLPADRISRRGEGGNLIVSRNHLIHFRHRLAEFYFGSHRVLLPAAAFVGTLGRIDRTAPHVTYVHFMCQTHAVIRANGVAAETFFPGPQALCALPPAQRREMERNPILLKARQEMKHAAPVLRMRDARFLLAEIFRSEMKENQGEITVH